MAKMWSHTILEYCDKRKKFDTRSESGQLEKKRFTDLKSFICAYLPRLLKFPCDPEDVSHYLNKI